MAKQNIGEVVAASMKEILESESHQQLFNKTAAAKKKCCACEAKCARKCPCKTDGGCKKSCAPCAEMAKKASEEPKKKCCDCVGNCGSKCPCAEKSENATCSDCSMCRDGMMSASAAFDMVRSLLSMSEEQESLGMHASAEKSYRAAAALMVEIRKMANIPLDENEVSELDAFIPDDDVTGLEDEDTKNLDSVLKDIVKNHPDFVQQFGRRMRDRSKEENESIDDVIKSMKNVSSDAVNIDDFIGPHEQRSNEDPDDTDPVELANSIWNKIQSEEDERETIPAPSMENFHAPLPTKPIEITDEDFEKNPTLLKSEPYPAFNEKPKPELFSDEEIDAALATDRFDTIISKFAYDLDFEDEDEGIDLEELFPGESSDLDAMMDDFLAHGDESMADDEAMASDSDLLKEAETLVAEIEAGQDVSLDEAALVRDDLLSLFHTLTTSGEDPTEHSSKVMVVADLHDKLVNYLETNGFPDPGEYFQDPNSSDLTPEQMASNINDFEEGFDTNDDSLLDALSIILDRKTNQTEAR